MKRLISIVVSILIMGGVVMFFSLNGDRQLSKEEQRNRQYEVSLVKALKNTYRDIESISIKNPRYNEKPGDWSCYVELEFESGDKIGYRLSHDLSLKSNGSAITTSEVNRLLDLYKGKTENMVYIYYSNNEKGRQ